MTGIGIPINHNNAPRPKPMTTSCLMCSEGTRAAIIGSTSEAIASICYEVKKIDEDYFVE